MAPGPDHVARCHDLEAHILATTVRLEFHGPAGGIGHGTVLGGRYLVTHNHYPIDGAALRDAVANGVTAVSLFKANGELVLLKVPISYLAVALVAPEMMVLDFKEYSGVGFFDTVGVPSAESRSWESLALQPGMEVAQVDWDGSTAHVDWVRVSAIRNEDGTEVLELDNFVQQGASGGGVFFGGFHLANNWLRATNESASGVVTGQFTIAALDGALAENAGLN
jgi:hypothetical protein